MGRTAPCQTRLFAYDTAQILFGRIGNFLPKAPQSPHVGNSHHGHGQNSKLPHQVRGHIGGRLRNRPIPRERSAEPTAHKKQYHKKHARRFNEHIGPVTQKLQ